MYAVIGIAVKKDKPRRTGLLDALDYAVTGVRYYDYTNNQVVYSEIDKLPLEVKRKGFVNVTETNTVFCKPVHTVVEYPLSAIPIYNKHNRIFHNNLIVGVFSTGGGKEVCVMPDDSIVEYDLSEYKAMEKQGTAYTVLSKHTQPCARDKRKLYKYSEMIRLNAEQGTAIFKLKQEFNNYAVKMQVLGVSMPPMYVTEMLDRWYKQNSKVVRDILAQHSILILDNLQVLLLSSEMQNIPAMFIDGLSDYYNRKPHTLILGKGLTVGTSAWYGRLSVDTLYIPTNYAVNPDTMFKVHCNNLIVKHTANRILREAPYLPPNHIDTLQLQWMPDWRVVEDDEDW